MKHIHIKTLALLLVTLLLAGMLFGCAGAADKAAMEAAPAEPMEAPMANEYYRNYADAEEAIVEEEVWVEESLTTAAGGSAEEITSENTTAKNSLAEKIIYTGYLNIETVEFDPAVAAVEAMVSEFGGFVESSEINGRTEYNDDGTSTLVDRNAYYVVRIPSKRFDEFLKRSGSIGNVLSSNTSAENITSQFTDAEARKDSLLIQEERLLAMMEQATDVESLIALESRLSEVRYEIEALERQLINWQNSVDYSTVSLSLQEVEIYTPVVPVQRSFGEKFTTALSDGWKGFVNFGERFILWLARSLPTLIILALITLGIVLLVRLLRRRNAEKRKKLSLRYAKPLDPQPTDPTEEQN